MNENIKVSNWEKVSLRIIMLFVVAMIFSFIPEISFMRDFFGDVYCSIEHTSFEDQHSEPTWHWGWRHWLFLFMGVALFITQAIKLGFFIDKTKFD